MASRSATAVRPSAGPDGGVAHSFYKPRSVNARITRIRQTARAPGDGMNVRRRPRCTFILSPDVPRGWETVGTTPPPRPAPQDECATPPHSLTRHTTSRHRSDQPLPHSGGSPGGPRPPHHQQPPDPRNQAPPRPRRTAHSGTFCAEGNRLRTKRPRFVTFCTKRYPTYKTLPCAQNVPAHHPHPHDQEPRLSARSPTSRAAPTHTTRNPNPPQTDSTSSTP